jgi:alpha-glucosidase
VIDRYLPRVKICNSKKSYSKINLTAWPCNTLGNHDTPRVFNNFGNGLHDQQLARLSLALMLTLRGSPFLYYGEEIGMTDLKLEEIGQFRNRLGVWLYQAQMQELGRSAAEALDQARKLTRDKCRTPMQWSNSPNAGFCPAELDPWLPVNPNFSQGVNVLDQLGDSHSLLEFYRAQVLDLAQVGLPATASLRLIFSSRPGTCQFTQPGVI